MKKLTPERREIVLQAIASGKTAFDEYTLRKLNTFTDEGRKVIGVYWKAQGTILECLNLSMTRVYELIQGEKSLDDFYDLDGKPKKMGKTNG